MTTQERMASLIREARGWRVDVQPQDHYYRAFIWEGVKCLRLGFGATPAKAAADAFLTALGMDIHERREITGPAS